MFGHLINLHDSASKWTKFQYYSVKRLFDMLGKNIKLPKDAKLQIFAPLLSINLHNQALPSNKQQKHKISALFSQLLITLRIIS